MSHWYLNQHIQGCFWSHGPNLTSIATLPSSLGDVCVCVCVKVSTFCVKHSKERLSERAIVCAYSPLYDSLHLVLLED